MLWVVAGSFISRSTALGHAVGTVAPASLICPKTASTLVFV